MNNKKEEKLICGFCGAEESDTVKIYVGNNEGKICHNCIIGGYAVLKNNFNISKDLKNFLDKKENQNQEENQENNLNEVKEIQILIDNLEENLYYPPKIKEKLDEYIIGNEEPKKVLSVLVHNHYKRVLNYLKSSKENDNFEKTNALLIGTTGTGKTLFAQTLANILNIPFAIADATTMTEAGYVGEDAQNVLKRLLKNADNDLEKAQLGIVFIDEIDKIATRTKGTSNRDVSGEGVQQSLLKMIEGTKIELTKEGSERNTTKSTIEFDTKNVLFICGGSFSGIEDILKEKLDGKKTLGFLNDSKKQSKEEIAEKKKELMKNIDIEDLKTFGLIPEFIGRLHSISVLDDLTKETLIKIMTEPKNSIIKQYQQMFNIEGTKLQFNKDSINLIAENAYENKTGARGLRRIIEKIMVDKMFNIEEYKNKEIKINKTFVSNHFPKLISKED